MRPTGSLVLTPAPHAPLRSAGVTVQKAALGGARVAPRSAPARAALKPRRGDGRGRQER